jgi:hypothetical protein
MDERPKVKAANPEWTVGDIMKEVAARYAKLTEGEKEKYKALAVAEFNAKQKAATARADDAADQEEEDEQDE